MYGGKFTAPFTMTCARCSYHWCHASPLLTPFNKEPRLPAAAAAPRAEAAAANTMQAAAAPLLHLLPWRLPSLASSAKDKVNMEEEAAIQTLPLHIAVAVAATAVSANAGQPAHKVRGRISSPPLQTHP